MLALEHTLVEARFDTPDIMVQISIFLRLARETPGCRLVVLNGRFLRNKRAFGIGEHQRFKVCDMLRVDPRELLKTCVSHGHLSVLFAPSDTQQFVRHFQRLHLYGASHPVPFSTGDRDDPLDKEGSLAFRSFLESPTGKSIQGLLGFSHDAAHFYEILPWHEP